MMVSVLVLTFNEEINLPACLNALTWCDDIVVLDSGSTDATVEIAKMHGARILTRPFDTFAAQRNYGLDHGQFRNCWVLHLDADEVATDEFRDALVGLSPADGIDAYQVPAKMMFFGLWLKHSGMFPTYQVRLGHRDNLRFKQVGHGQQEDLPPHRVGVFSEAYLHYSFSHGLRPWLEKHVRYAADEAALILATRSSPERNNPLTLALGGSTALRRRAKLIAASLPLYLRPPARFIYNYIWRQGFRDGKAGFVYAVMLSVFEGMIAILVYEEIFRRRRRN